MLYVDTVGTLFLIWLLLVLLFTPALNYRVRTRVPVSSADFLHLLESTCQASMHGGNRAEVFTNGSASTRRCSRPFEAPQIGEPRVLYLPAGRSATSPCEALAERARAGVIVTLVVDAIGSSGCPADRWQLTDAGCRLECYQPSAGTAWPA